MVHGAYQMKSMMTSLENNFDILVIFSYFDLLLFLNTKINYKILILIR